MLIVIMMMKMTQHEEDLNLEEVEKISLDDVQRICDLYEEIFTRSSSVASIIEIRTMLDEL